MINTEALEEIKIATSYNDRPYVIRSFTSFPDQFCNISTLAECFGECDYYDCHVLPLMEWGDTASSMRINYNNWGAQLKKKTIDEGGGHDYLSKKRADQIMLMAPEKYFESQHTLKVYNYEKYSNLCRDMVNELLDIFTLDIDIFGVWPAAITPSKGAVHVTYAKQGEQSGHPRGELYNSFFLCTHGKSTFQLYKNRTSGLVDKNLPFDWPKEKRISFFNSLEVAEEITLLPGDLLYIPERQMFHEKSDLERIVVNFPLITKGPHSTYQAV